MLEPYESPLPYCPKCENYYTSLVCSCYQIPAEELKGLVHRQKVRRMVERLDVAELYSKGYKEKCHYQS